MNDRRLRVAARKNLADALVTTGIPHRGREGHARFLKEIELVMPEVAGIRRTGSAALDLAWVAAGRFDAYWEHNLQPWDLAAGLVIVHDRRFCQRSQGRRQNLENGDVLAANATLHKAFGAIISIRTNGAPGSAEAAL